MKVRMETVLKEDTSALMRRLEKSSRIRFPDSYSKFIAEYNLGIPVTNQPNHGIGVRSICALVERYEGIYTFEVEEGKFILRISI